MHKYIIYLVDECWNDPVAEMTFNRLTRAYNFAGGSGIAQAKASMSSIRLPKLSEEDPEKTYEECVS